MKYSMLRILCGAGMGVALAWGGITVGRPEFWFATIFMVLYGFLFNK